MGFLSKVKAQATNIGEGLSSSTSKLAGNVLTSTKENSKLVAIKAEITSIDGDLEFAYKAIGKKYIEHASQNGECFDFGVQAILESIAPKIDKKEKLQDEIIQIEKELKDQLLMQEKAVFQREFDEIKSKLDKALKMDVISASDHSEKLAKAQKRVDNFLEIRKVEKQCEMGLLSEDEKNEKLALLS